MDERSPPASDPGPLAGLRILDLTRLLPGGYCTLLLADLGANVVKVEEPERGDHIRWTPPLTDGVGAAHRALNRGKRSIAVNLKVPEGANLMRRLAKDADVVVEGFRPGVAERLGIGYLTLAEVNPRLVYCSITGYGQDGPYRDRPGHDLNYVGYTGLLSLGSPGAPPTVPGIQVADLAGGMMAAAGILAALVERSTTGRGRYVDVSMLDAAVSWLSIHAGAHLAGGWDRPLSGALACYRLYRAADGLELTVGALEPPFWHALCQTLGLPELASEQFAPRERQGEMAAMIQSAFATRDRDEWLEVFGDVPACVGPVNDLDGALADRQVRHRGMVAEMDGVPVGMGSPLHLGTPAGAMRPAPGLGEHTAMVLAEAGIGPGEIEALVAWGAIALGDG